MTTTRAILVSRARRRVLRALAALAGALVPAIVLPLVLAPVAQAATWAAPASASHGSWVWTRPDPATLVAYASAQRVTDLYVSVPARLRSSDTRWLRDVHDRATAGGIRLWALGGDPAWLGKPDAAVAWQRQALTLNLFAGSHVDVEPYALAAWSTQPGTLAAQHVSLLRRLQADSPLPLQADVPFWMHEYTAGSVNWADGVLASVDGVTVMSYRDSAQGILDTGADLLARGDAAGVPVQLGAETQALADCAYCTFFEEGRSALDAALATVDATARAAHPSYAGTSVHDYAHWTALAP